MIRVYDFRDALAGVPRMMIAMEIFGDGLVVGYNQHYSLDSNIVECLEHFFKYMRIENPGQKPCLKRSKLEIVYHDLPKEKEACLTENVATP